MLVILSLYACHPEPAKDLLANFLLSNKQEEVDLQRNTNQCRELCSKILRRLRMTKYACHSEPAKNLLANFLLSNKQEEVDLQRIPISAKKFAARSFAGSGCQNTLVILSLRRIFSQTSCCRISKMKSICKGIPIYAKNFAVRSFAGSG